MKLTRRQILRGSGVLATGFLLAGCSARSAALGSGWPAWLRRLLGMEEGASSAASSGAASSAASSSAASSAPALPPYLADPLTGEVRSADTRIVGIMVNNISNSTRQNARPQRGLSDAGMLIESRVEGNISRFCALYSNVDAIPEVGPIRSGRDQFLQLLMPWQGLYYHDGESIFCTQYIKQWNYWDLNIGGKSYFSTPTHPHVAHRDSRGGVVAYEHTEFTSGPEIRQAAENAGIGLNYAYDATFFPFTDYRKGEINPMTDCPEAENILVYHSANYQSKFAYDRSDRVYTMQMYSARTKTFEAAVDELNGQQLTFANLLVCFAPIAAYPGDSADVQCVEYAGGGAAWYFTRGRVLACQWQKPAPDQPLTVWNGADQVVFNRGKTYLAVVDVDALDHFDYGSV